jgi:S1-C subfamily serine protease
MRTFPIPSDDLFTDDQGRFDLHSVPAGEIAIVCQPPDPGYSVGITALTLGPTDHPTINVFLVERKQPGGGTIGATFDSLGTVGKIVGVIPGGAAERVDIKAGDIVKSVDGASVDALSASGVELLILDRPLGSSVKLTLLRGSVALPVDFKVGD